MLSVAITTFNRKYVVCRAIQSALDFVKPVGGMVVVVDDGSTDLTEHEISNRFYQHIMSGKLLYFLHERNQGVTAAKNTAFSLCPAHWILFLDSDDELIKGVAEPVIDLLLKHRDEALVFFRCVDQKGGFIGRQFVKPKLLTLPIYASHASYGEALIAINKPVAPDPPFDADLRGYEGVGCARLISRHGPALLSTIIARRYNLSRRDRLSSFAGTLQRSAHLAQGHLRYIAICGAAMQPSTRYLLLVKALMYYLLSFIAKLLPKND